MFDQQGNFQHSITLPERETKAWPTTLLDADGTHLAIAYNDATGIEMIDYSKKPFSFLEWVKYYIGVACLVLSNN